MPVPCRAVPQACPTPIIILHAAGLPVRLLGTGGRAPGCRKAAWHGVGCKLPMQAPTHTHQHTYTHTNTHTRTHTRVLSCSSCLMAALRPPLLPQASQLAAESGRANALAAQLEAARSAASSSALETVRGRAGSLGSFAGGGGQQAAYSKFPPRRHGRPTPGAHAERGEGAARRCCRCLGESFGPDRHPPAGLAPVLPVPAWLPAWLPGCRCAARPPLSSSWWC